MSSHWLDGHFNQTPAPGRCQRQMSPMLDEPIDQLTFLRQMPKAEIHCHLFGTIGRDTMLALCAKNRVDIPRDEIEGYYIRGEKPKGVLHIFRQLEGRIVRDDEDLYRITADYLAETHRHGVRYSEFFWNPTGVLKATDLSYAAAQAAIIRAIHDAEQSTGLISRLIPAIDRQDSPEAAHEMVALVCDNRAPEVIGIGIDYNEVDRPPELFWKAWRLAQRHGLQTTAHAGEFGVHWRNIETAIDLIGVSRIDHGYTILDNPDLVRRCADSGIVFTVVPTNSFYLRTLKRGEWAKKHPIRHMPGAGLRIHPNTDDPTFHNVTPTGTWQMMVRDFGFSLDDLRGFLINGLDGAWIDVDTRRRWKQDWLGEFDTLRARVAS